MSQEDLISKKGQETEGIQFDSFYTSEGLKSRKSTHIIWVCKENHKRRRKENWKKKNSSFVAYQK